MSSRDPKNWMWAEACELLDRAERIHRQFFQLGVSSSRPTWQPPVDVYETEDEFVFVIALPGVPPERLSVGVQDDGVLVVAGERPLPPEAQVGAIHRLEIPQGYFERRIPLPPGRFALQRQEFSDGCLLLGLRKLR